MILFGLGSTLISSLFLGLTINNVTVGEMVQNISIALVTISIILFVIGIILRL